jgi:type IV pilus assembly protein PilE
MEKAMKTQKQKGFTLIELMIAVVVIGILSAIAYPNYTAYLMRGRIATATGGWRIGKSR